MNKLLSANFARLRKDRLFLFGIIAMFALAVYFRVSQYISVTNWGVIVTLDSLFFGYALFIGFAMAIFSSIFLGTEYSDGTIRNKLIVGHSRTNIYFANLITNIVAALLLCSAYLIASLGLGIPLLGFLEMETGLALQLFFMTILLAVAYSAIFTMLSMVCSNRTTVAVVSIILSFALIIIATDVYSKLAEPEFYPGITIVNEQGVQELESISNRRYLTGNKREIYQFIFDFIPSGQAMQISNPNMDIALIHPYMLPLSSLIISLVTTLIGVLVFRRKDFK